MVPVSLLHLLFSGVARPGRSRESRHAPSSPSVHRFRSTVSGTSPCGACTQYATAPQSLRPRPPPVTQTHVSETRHLCRRRARMANCAGSVHQDRGDGQALRRGGDHRDHFAPNPASCGNRSPKRHGARTCAFVVSFGDGNPAGGRRRPPHDPSHTYALVKTYTVIVAPRAVHRQSSPSACRWRRAAASGFTGLTIDPMPGTSSSGVLLSSRASARAAIGSTMATANREDRSKLLPDRMHHVYNTAGSYVIAVEATGTCEGRTHRTLDVR